MKLVKMIKAILKSRIKSQIGSWNWMDTYYWKEKYKSC